MIHPTPRSAIPRRRPRLRPPGVVHHLAAVLSLGLRQPLAESSGALMRRRRQRLVLAQRLLDSLPDGLSSSSRLSADRFWQALRWGGLGLILAWLLRH